MLELEELEKQFGVCRSGIISTLDIVGLYKVLMHSSSERDLQHRHEITSSKFLDFILKSRLVSELKASAEKIRGMLRSVVNQNEVTEAVAKHSM